ncbi:MAG: nucleotide exchange factor GrpE, partial [Gammaproteobacteria bacterium]|nr:nucleotide exchange factor GrpE [Gammaproteobacteria bacterium]
MSQYKEAPDPAAQDKAAPETEAGTSHDLEPATEIQQLQAELEKARAEAAESLDRFLRAKAEAENTRKRGELDVAATR